MSRYGLTEEAFNINLANVQKKNNTELARNNALVKKLYPRLASASGYTGGGSGSSAGREAGGSVSLNRQVVGSSRRRLGGV